MNKGLGFLGVFLVLAAVVGTSVYKFWNDKQKEVVTVTLRGVVGGEKADFLASPEVKELLLKKGIVLDISKKGSIEMASEATTADFIWPSNQIAAEIYKKKNPSGNYKIETIFNSPLVIYSWAPVVDGLMQSQMVEKDQSEVYYLNKTKELVNLSAEGKTSWEKLGVKDIYGNVLILSTDPTKSNSGNMFTGLLANVFANNEPTRENLNLFMPKISAYFKKLGSMETSSSEIFSQYIRTGVGAKPMIIGYENQLIEWAAANPQLWAKASQKVRIVYPKPTIWTEHPLIAISPQAKVLIDALRSPELKEIAWKKHGFRSGLESNVADIPVKGLADTISQAINMPSADVMQEIISQLNVK